MGGSSIQWSARNHPEGSNAKLTAAMAAEIRQALAADMSRVELAGTGGVAAATVSAIALGHTWRHIAGPAPTPRGSATNTGHWGVTGNSAMNRFYVFIRIDGKRVSLGCDRDPVEGGRRYDAKARELRFPRVRMNSCEDARARATA